MFQACAKSIKILFPSPNAPEPLSTFPISHSDTTRHVPSEIVNELNKFTVHPPVPSTSTITPATIVSDHQAQLKQHSVQHDSTLTSPKCKKKKGKEKAIPADTLRPMEVEEGD